MTAQAKPLNIAAVPYSMGTGLALAAALIVGMPVGTGGAETPDLLLPREAVWVIRLRPSSMLPTEKTASARMRDPAGDLEHIKEYTSTAGFRPWQGRLGVSRQAIYDWQAGKAVAP